MGGGGGGGGGGGTAFKVADLHLRTVLNKLQSMSNVCAELGPEK